MRVALGGGGNVSHAVNNFRKIAGMESNTRCDDVSELTARVNDDGWDSIFFEWPRGGVDAYYYRAHFINGNLVYCSWLSAGQSTAGNL